jgi:hypothetical protein
MITPAVGCDRPESTNWSHTMLHQIAFVFVLGFGFLFAALAQQDVATERADAQAIQKGEAAARAVLDKPVADVKFDDMPLAEAVDQIRNLTGANIFVNWKALEAIGIDRNTPVSVHLRGKKLSTVLELVLAIVGGERTKLDYAVDEGVITISTHDDLAKNVIVRVYDIRDLIFPQVNRGVQVARLTRLIEHNVDAASWKDAGGSVGALRELEGQLIVTHTRDNHRRIVAMLQDLRGSSPHMNRDGHR